MSTQYLIATRFVAPLAAAVALTWSLPAAAHCDTLDGRVVAAARKALDAGKPGAGVGSEEGRSRDPQAFRQDRGGSQGELQAKDLADMYFFETLVRIHRAGEGAGCTGLKPAGRIEPPIAAADKSLDTGKRQEVAQLGSKRMEQGLHRHFEDMMRKKKYKPDDVATGRAFASAYVEYMHYVERLYNAAETLAPEHVQKAAPGLAYSH